MSPADAAERACLAAAQVPDEAFVAPVVAVLLREVRDAHPGATVTAAAHAEAGGAAVVLVIAVGNALSENESSSDVILDEPGEYQQPGIPTNAPLAGTALDTATILDLDGNDVDVATLLDGRPLLINFWFSNCQPCKREMPALQSAWATFGDRVRFIGVNTQDSASITRSFAEDVGVEYELLRDPDAVLVTANGIATFPTTLFVSADGTIQLQIAGEASAKDLESALENLLGPS